MEATPRIELGVGLLQSPALPLGYVAGVVWSGWRESNPRINLGKVAGYHYITPAPDPRRFRMPPCEPWRPADRFWVDTDDASRRPRRPRRTHETPARPCPEPRTARLRRRRAAAQSSDDQTETQIGQQEYQALEQKGEIIGSSPYYAILNPIAQQIKRVADPQYYHPFRFILVHESQPNAFAVPGGNVYVTDSLMKFVKNREELAGVLCHETSHNIHHDVLHLYQKQQKTATAYTIGDILANIATGGRASRTIDTIANVGFNLQSLHYSRDVEAAADYKGAQTCAEAGSNPWGMVWLFQAFQTAEHQRAAELPLGPPQRPGPHRGAAARVPRRPGDRSAASPPASPRPRRWARTRPRAGPPPTIAARRPSSARRPSTAPSRRARATTSERSAGRRRPRDRESR